MPRKRSSRQRKAMWAKMKGRYPQKGRSIKSIDEQRPAKRVGWRKSKKGKLYFENRKNRSDRKSTWV
jgi:hypothetical protein